MRMTEITRAHLVTKDHLLMWKNFLIVMFSVLVPASVPVATDSIPLCPFAAQFFAPWYGRSPSPLPLHQSPFTDEPSSRRLAAESCCGQSALVLSSIGAPPSLVAEITTFLEFVQYILVPWRCIWLVWRLYATFPTFTERKTFPRLRTILPLLHGLPWLT